MRTIEQFKQEFPDLSPQRLSTAYHLLEVVGVSEELQRPSRGNSVDSRAILEQIINNIDEQSGNYLP